MIKKPQPFDFEKDEQRKQLLTEMKNKEATLLREAIAKTTDIKEKIIYQLRLIEVEKLLDNNNKFDLIEERVKWCENYIGLKQQLYDYNLKRINAKDTSELMKIELALINLEIEADIEAKMNWVAKYKEHIERTTKTK
jgi:hypothetical protein